MRVVMLSLLALGLSGCAGTPYGDMVASPQELMQRDDAYCRSIGTAFGTPDYADCRMFVTQQRNRTMDRLINE